MKNAIRGLRAAPIVSGAAILSLALGVGATTAMFSILDALILRTLPVREPSQLMFVHFAIDPQTSWTNPIWEALRARQAGVFESSAAWGNTRFDLAASGETVPVNGMFVNGRFFETLGVPAVMGRALTAEDDRRGGGPNGPVAVISHSFWQRHYGGAPDVVGRTLSLQRVPYTVVGVTDARFTGPDVGRQFDVAVPIGTEPLIRGADSALDARSSWWLSVVGRLERGLSPEDATARLNAMKPQIRQATLPDWPPEQMKHYLSQPFMLRSAAGGDSSLRIRYARPLTIMMGAVGLVLLIACANIANLLLARADARRRELSVRLALGASRSRLGLQVFAESVVLAVIGAAAGLLVAQWGSSLLVQQLSTQVNTVFLDVSPDWRVLAFTSSLAGLTAIIFGTVPALRAGRVRAGEVLITESRGVQGQGQGAFGAALVVTQVALSLVLVVGAGVFVQTFRSLAGRDLGFQSDSILVTSINASRSNVPPEARIAHFDRIREAVLALPGVLSASGSVVTPVSGSTWQYQVDVPDRPDLPRENRGVHVNVMQPDWFRTYQTPLLAGRDFTANDRRGTTPVAILNETAVKRLFGDMNPIGRIVHEPAWGRGPDINFEVIGVARDAVYRSLRAEPPPTMYRALAQQPEPSSYLSLSIRAAQGNPLALTKAVSAAVQQVDPDASLTFRALDDQVNAALIQERLLAMLSGFFAALALLLAGLGLYGVTAYAVNRRRVEMSIRMALGSTPRRVVALVMRRVAWLVGLGVAIGGAASYWAISFVSSLAWGIQPRDLTTFVVSVAVLATVGIAAGWLPARRASRLDPGAVLRE